MDYSILQVYSQLGFALFPCSNEHKGPLTPHGFKDATTDLKQLADWHNLFPDCAWGCATTAERGVIDVDVKYDGPKVLENLEADMAPCPKRGEPKPAVAGGTIGFGFQPEHDAAHPSKGSTEKPTVGTSSFRRRVCSYPNTREAMRGTCALGSVSLPTALNGFST